jgi:hypothetical protein
MAKLLAILEIVERALKGLLRNAKQLCSRQRRSNIERASERRSVCAWLAYDRIGSNSHGLKIEVADTPIIRIERCRDTQSFSVPIDEEQAQPILTVSVTCQTSNNNECVCQVTIENVLLAAVQHVRVTVCGSGCCDTRRIEPVAFAKRERENGLASRDCSEQRFLLRFAANGFEQRCADK